MPKSKNVRAITATAGGVTVTVRDLAAIRRLAKIELERQVRSGTFKIGANGNMSIAKTTPKDGRRKKRSSKVARKRPVDGRRPAREGKTVMGVRGKPVDAKRSQGIKRGIARKKAVKKSA